MSEERKEKVEMEEKTIIEQVQPEPQPPVRSTSQSWFFTPLSEHGFPVWSVYALAVLGFIYMLNPTLGVLEFIPDNLPGIGNLDEGVAFMLLWAGLVEYFEGRKKL
ncbi:MAG: DUF1232 domain-containing protein [Anaerolineaceae bacterium]|nr:DUF1232 domain-containing protein [Anaerolineaceae bacterium]